MDEKQTFHRETYKGWAIHVFEQAHIRGCSPIGASAVKSLRRLGTGAWSPEDALKRIRKMVDDNPQF